MAYIHDGEHYVYSSGDFIHMDGYSMPTPVFEALVAMYWLRMKPEQQEAAIERAYARYGGSFGCEGVAKHLGKPSVYEQLGFKREEA